MKFISEGKITVSSKIGMIMRQSRNWSRTSRRVMMRAGRSSFSIHHLDFIKCADRLEINLFEASGNLPQADNRDILVKQKAQEFFEDKEHPRLPDLGWLA